MTTPKERIKRNKEGISNCKFISLPVLIFLSVTTLDGAGQNKYEREYDLKRENVPVLATNFIDSCCPKHKVNWYGEESLQGKSIEAKINYKASLFSIEFDTSGRIQDIEKLIQIHEIPENTILIIKKQLDSIFRKHRIKKVQLQWLGTNQAVCELLQKNRSELQHTVNYEIVLQGAKQKSTKMYELLFNVDGGLVRVLEIVQRNTDNLDY